MTKTYNNPIAWKVDIALNKICHKANKEVYSNFLKARRSLTLARDEVQLATYVIEPKASKQRRYEKLVNFFREHWEVCEDIKEMDLAGIKEFEQWLVGKSKDELERKGLTLDKIPKID